MEDAYSTQMQALVQTANDQLHAVIFHASAFLNCTAALTTMPEVDPVNALETSLSLPAADAPEIIRFSRAFAPPGAAADAEEEASQAALQGVGAEAVAHRDALRAANAALDTSLHAIDRLAAAGTAADAAAAQGGAETAAVARPAGLSDAEYIAHLAKLKNEKLQVRFLSYESEKSDEYYNHAAIYLMYLTKFICFLLCLCVVLSRRRGFALAMRH